VFNSRYFTTTWVSHNVKPLWILVQQEMMVVAVVPTGKFQSDHQDQNTNTQFFTGQMPFLLPDKWCQSAEGK